MKPLQRRRGFGSFLFAPAQASFSENAIKLMLIGRPLWCLPATQQGRLVSLMFLSLLAPVRARFGYELLEGDGMTEASPLLSQARDTPPWRRSRFYPESVSGTRAPDVSC